MKKLHCETCKSYCHIPSIIGGVAYCAQDIKPLFAMIYNDACDKYIETKTDNLSGQKEMYKEVFGGYYEFK